MTRCITETFYGFDQPDLIVTTEDGLECYGELRAWALDDETGEWWGFCQYRVALGRQMLGWMHEDHLRRNGDLVYDDGLATNGLGST